LDRMFDTRQQAAIAIFTVLAILALSRRDMRSQLLSILALLRKPKILATFAAYYGWLVGAHLIAQYLGVWVQALKGDSIFWIFLTGMPLLFKASDAGKKETFFRAQLIATIKVSAFLEFFLGIKTLGLAGELALQPIVTILVAIRIIAPQDQAGARLRCVIDWILSLITMSLIACTAVWLEQNWSASVASAQARKLALPIWLTAASVPFLYGFALVATYGMVFSRMNHLADTPKSTKRARVGIALGFLGCLQQLHRFSGAHLEEAAKASNVREALQAASDSRDSIRQAADMEKRRLARLKEFSGAEGVDHRGLRLDRREFMETKRALEYLWCCQVGWHRQLGRYRDDLLTMLGDFNRQGLPQPHGIVLEVQEDGQAWHACRQTPSGWVLAVGAVGGPLSKWFYEASIPPTSTPGSDASWSLQSAEWDHVES
jgi:hypothetical protein